MPYDNAYNRQIANELNAIDRRYATLYAYSPVDGRNDSGFAVGGSNAGVLFQMGNASKRDAEDNMYNDELNLPPQYFYGNNAEAMMNQEEMTGGSGFAEGTYRDTGYGHQIGASSTVGIYDKGMGMSGGNLWTDIYQGFDDMGKDIGKATDYIFGSAKPQHFRVLGRMIGHKMKGMGMSGGSWWDSLKEGVSDIVGYIPDLAIHALGGADPAVREVGGAILGNPDPYPVKGNSERIAGRGKITEKEKEALESVLEKHEPEKRGRGRPKGSGKKQLISSNGDLLAMPSPVALANGVPPKAQLRGAYGGAKPEMKIKEAVMKAIDKKMKGGKNLSGMTDKRQIGGKNLSGMTDKRSEMSGGDNLKGMTDKRSEMSGGSDARKKRAEIVKKVMKEKGMKMIEASKYVKEHNLYKK